jgi:tetratricopeptide (TPR) repeat protein
MRIAALFFVVIMALVAPGVRAQSDAITDPREFSEAARKVYAQSLQNARALINAHKYDEAIVVLDKLTAERPREPQARFLKGVALADAGRTDGAIEVFRSVIGDYPELPEPHNNLAVLFAKKGEYTLARDELEAAIAAAPDYAVAYENLGDIYARLAAVNYEQATTRDARNRNAAAKLKLVRDALGSATAATTATPPAAASTISPGTSPPRVEITPR